MTTALRGRRRWTAAVAAGFACTTLLAACSSSSDSASETSSAPAAASSAASSPAASTAASSAPSVAASAGADLAALLPADIADAGVLKVATSLYPPVDFYDADGETLIGFDAELVNEIGKRLGVEIEWNVIDFANVLPGIQSGQYAFATDLNDTAEREEVVDFVTEFRDGTSIMVPTDNPNAIVDLTTLCGLKVVVTKGSTQVALVETQTKACEDAGSPAIDLVEVPDDPEAIQAMRSGRADAYLVNTLAGSYATTNGAVEGFTVLPGVYDEVYAGMIFPKASTQLRDAVLAALQSTIDDGFYLETMKKYGVENNAIDTATVNAASAG